MNTQPEANQQPDWQSNVAWAEPAPPPAEWENDPPLPPELRSQDTGDTGAGLLPLENVGDHSVDLAPLRAQVDQGQQPAATTIGPQSQTAQSVVPGVQPPDGVSESGGLDQYVFGPRHSDETSQTGQVPRGLSRFRRLLADRPRRGQRPPTQPIPPTPVSPEAQRDAPSLYLLAAELNMLPEDGAEREIIASPYVREGVFVLADGEGLADGGAAALAAVRGFNGEATGSNSPSSTFSEAQGVVARSFGAAQRESRQHGRGEVNITGGKVVRLPDGTIHLLVAQVGGNYVRVVNIHDKTERLVVPRSQTNDPRNYDIELQHGDRIIVGPRSMHDVDTAVMTRAFDAPYPEKASNVLRKAMPDDRVRAALVVDVWNDFDSAGAVPAQGNLRTADASGPLPPEKRVTTEVRSNESDSRVVTSIDGEELPDVLALPNSQNSDGIPMDAPNVPADPADERRGFAQRVAAMRRRALMLGEAKDGSTKRLEKLRGRLVRMQEDDATWEDMHHLLTLLGTKQSDSSPANIVNDIPRDIDTAPLELLRSLSGNRELALELRGQVPRQTYWNVVQWLADRSKPDDTYGGIDNHAGAGYREVLDRLTPEQRMALAELVAGSYEIIGRRPENFAKELDKAGWSDVRDIARLGAEKIRYEAEGAADSAIVSMDNALINLDLIDPYYGRNLRELRKARYATWLQRSAGTIADPRVRKSVEVLQAYLHEAELIKKNEVSAWRKYDWIDAPSAWAGMLATSVMVQGGGNIRARLERWKNNAGDVAGHGATEGEKRKARVVMSAVILGYAAYRLSQTYLTAKYGLAYGSGDGSAIQEMAGQVGPTPSASSEPSASIPTEVATPSASSTPELPIDTSSASPSVTETVTPSATSSPRPSIIDGPNPTRTGSVGTPKPSTTTPTPHPTTTHPHPTKTSGATHPPVTHSPTPDVSPSTHKPGSRSGGTHTPGGAGTHTAPAPEATPSVGDKGYVVVGPDSTLSGIAEDILTQNHASTSRANIDRVTRALIEQNKGKIRNQTRGGVVYHDMIIDGDRISTGNAQRVAEQLHSGRNSGGGNTTVQGAASAEAHQRAEAAVNGLRDQRHMTDVIQRTHLVKGDGIDSYLDRIGVHDDKLRGRIVQAMNQDHGLREMLTTGNNQTAYTMADHQLGLRYPSHGEMSRAAAEQLARVIAEATDRHHKQLVDLLAKEYDLAA